MEKAPGQNDKKPNPLDGKEITYATVDLGDHPVVMTVNGGTLKVRNLSIRGKLGGKGHLGLITTAGGYSDFGDFSYAFDMIPKAWDVQLKLLPVADPAKRKRQLYEITGAPIQDVSLRLVVPTQAGDSPRLVVLDRFKNQATLRVITLETVASP
jgi:hypothetical protein